MEIMKEERDEHLETALVAYLEMMEKQEYFEAHEVLEGVWYPMRKKRDDLANLLRGLINAAVAFEHLKRGKPGAVERAQKVMRSYDRYAPLCETAVPEATLFRQACKEVRLLKERQSEVFNVLVS